MNTSIAGATSGTKGAAHGLEASRRVAPPPRAGRATPQLHTVNSPQNPPLVTTGKSADPPSFPADDVLIAITGKNDEFSDFRSKRYLLQRTAKKLLPSHPVGSCLWHVARGENGVEVEYSAATERARYRKLQTCGSVWVCPVCAPIIAERRAEEIRNGLAALNDQGGSAAFATLTVSHGRGDSLERILEGFLAAFRYLTAKPSYKRLKARYGVIGYVRVLEVTHGRNGWHPHAHLLFCFERVVSPGDLAAFADALYPLWEAAAAREGLVMRRAYGLHVVPAYGTVEEYLAKFGRAPSWDIARELTKGHVKAGRSVAGTVQLTPMQLLEAAHAGDDRCGRLFAEFGERFVGKAQLYWSPGLRARLLPDDQAVSDAEVVAASDEAARVALELSVSEWEAVKRLPHGRTRVLDLVEVARGDGGQARAFVLEAVALYPAPARRDLTRMAPDLRAAVDALAAEQRERNAWRGPLVGAVPVPPPSAAAPSTEP